LPLTKASLALDKHKRRNKMSITKSSSTAVSVGENTGMSWIQNACENKLYRSAGFGTGRRIDFRRCGTLDMRHQSGLSAVPDVVAIFSVA